MIRTLGNAATTTVSNEQIRAYEGQALKEPELEGWYNAVCGNIQTWEIGAQ